MIWGAILSLLSSMVGPVFTWLNNRVDADKQKHIVEVNTAGDVVKATTGAVVNADNINGQIRREQGAWGPMTLFMAAVLAPLVWHLWQVVGDSSRWLPAVDYAWGFIPYPTVAEHTPGSWRVPPLPGAWEAIELSIFSSLFVGATAAVGAVAAITAFGKVIRK